MVNTFIKICSKNNLFSKISDLNGCWTGIVQIVKNFRWDLIIDHLANRNHFRIEIILQLQSKPMLEYSNADYSMLQDAPYIKLRNNNRYRQKGLNTLSQNHDFSHCPSLSRHKLRLNSQDSQNDSIDTCQSDQYINLSDTRRTKSNKLKVQLCKNYVEKGYCPYETRCRFAHGVQQLRAKDTCCSSELYRTRKCKVFFEKHECKFGERCNFMHENRKLADIVGQSAQSIRSALRSQFLQVGVACAPTRLCSRLLSMLQIEKNSI